MHIKRKYHNIINFIEPNKILVIYGPRQAGKTTLIKDSLKNCKLKFRMDTGDNIIVRNILSSQDADSIIKYVEGYDLFIVDEAQKIPRIGESLKILIDQRPDLKIIVTGSSSFELAGQVGEPLTGRKKTLTLFPISQAELSYHYPPQELKEKLKEMLVFGSYPDVVTAKTIEKKKIILEELTNSYLLKDILEFDRIKNSKVLLDLLRLLAFQIGSEVSLTELGQKVGLDHKTVARYLDILEKTFVLYNVRGYSRNLRKEIVKKSKYYFYDNGIRNTLIANFNDLNLRNDIGELWENFIFIERMKKRNYNKIYANVYFWRTWDKEEIDIVEERDGKLFGFECKVSDKKVKIPNLWKNAYPESEFQVITKKNYLDFII